MNPMVSLSWNSHQKSICNGLSILQQRGEFVDMTLAADGYHVKVHQMVISLVSPFIKDLIASAQCQHPVIFLNKISYETLKSILEYAYTGEVLVKQDCLYQFLEACRSLHIKGLEDESIKMSADRSMFPHTGHFNDTTQSFPREQEGLTSQSGEQHKLELNRTNNVLELVQQNTTEMVPVDDDNVMDQSHISEDTLDDFKVEPLKKATDTQVNDYTMAKKKQEAVGSTLHYSLSCQGSIQIILNRYLYRLRHTRKNNEKMWRCGDYNKKRCPAYVITKGDIVLERGCAHSHAFHDNQILKRVRKGNIFTQFHAVQHHALFTKKIAVDGSTDRDSGGESESYN